MTAAIIISTTHGQGKKMSGSVKASSINYGAIRKKEPFPIKSAEKARSKYSSGLFLTLLQHFFNFGKSFSEQFIFGFNLYTHIA